MRRISLCATRNGCSRSPWTCCLIMDVHGRVVTGTNKRPLKSLSDTLKGKTGTVSPESFGKACGLFRAYRYHGGAGSASAPVRTAQENGFGNCLSPLFITICEKKGLVSTVKSAKKMVEREEIAVWDALDHVVREISGDAQPCANLASSWNPGI